jgi:putative solute:sodium symporter small subunit
MDVSKKHKEYWKKLLSLTAILMLIWFVATFVIAWYARELSSITFFGWPLPFYMGAQGSLVIYLGIIAFYAYRMNRLDNAYGVQEKDDE